MAETTKHTPGPWAAWNISSAGWQVGTKAQFDRRAKAQAVGYGNIACLAFYQMRPGHNGGPFYSEQQEEAEAADAHLIAAAPDLLVACEAALRALTDEECATLSLGGMAVVALAQEKLTKAIAKAHATE